MKHGPLDLEYSKITDYIYLGTNMCCVTHFDKSLLKKGIKADISLEGEKQDQAKGVEFYLWLPTKDHTAPTQKQLNVGVALINSLISQKIKIYIHCQRGHGRAPTLVGSYLISTGMSVGEAVSFIKKRRPTIHPNRKQITALKKFSQSLEK